MANIPNLPEHLQDAPGVEMTPPPLPILNRATEMISQITQAMPDGNGLTWIAMRKDGQTILNLAAVQRKGEHFEVVEWIGKTWGEPVEVGIAGRWKF